MEDSPWCAPSEDPRKTMYDASSIGNPEACGIQRAQPQGYTDVSPEAYSREAALPTTRPKVKHCGPGYYRSFSPLYEAGQLV